MAAYNAPRRKARGREEGMRLEELAGAPIMWEVTPRSAWGSHYPYSDGPLRADAAAVLDGERRGGCDAEAVGRGFFCVEVRDMRADLALVRCAPPGHWEAELVEQDLVRPEESRPPSKPPGAPWTGATTTRSRPGSGTPCAPPSTYKKKREEKVWVASPPKRRFDWALDRALPARSSPTRATFFWGVLPGGHATCRG